MENVDNLIIMSTSLFDKIKNPLQICNK